MSADLFAEFSQGSAKPALSAQSTQQPSFHSAVRSPTQHDIVDFGGNDKKSYSRSSPSNPSHPAQQSSRFPPQSAWSSSAAVAAQQPQNVADEDDGWGDFEVAEPNAPQPSQPVQTFQQSQSQTIAWPGTTATQTTSMPAMSDRYGSNAHSQFAEGQPQQRQTFPDSSFSSAGQSTFPDTGAGWSMPKPKRKNPVPSQANDSGVLFDAEDFELEDGEFEGESDNEFGDFETVNQTAPTVKPAAQVTRGPTRAPSQPSMPSMDLLSLDDSIPVQGSLQPKPDTSSASGALRFGASMPANSETKRSSMHDLGFEQFEKQAAPVKTQPKVQPNAQPKAQPKRETKTQTASNDDEWAAWDDGPSAGASTSAFDMTPAPSSWDWDSTDTPTENKITSPDSTPPPVNVPPPSVLLSLFPELLSSASALFKSTSGQRGSVKEQILSNPKAVQFLQGYILLATTAARIMAGRKHRWHRDKILAKSMSISAAGSKGMKLAGVDKTQAAREDREAADVVAVWREHVGRLRSAVTAANAAANARLRVPELSETLSAHAAKMVGTSPKACVVCGLKRDERISKVDFEVEDSFGEWWVEHWGHRACKNFWIEHEKKLRQR